ALAAGGHHSGELALGEAELDLDAVGDALAVLLGQLEQLLGQSARDVEKGAVLDHRVASAEPSAEHGQEVQRDVRLAPNDLLEGGALEHEGDGVLERHERGGAGEAVEDGELAE